MKEWPKNNKPVDFECILTPLLKALSFGLENPNTDIPYDGLNIGKKERATNCNPLELLTVESLWRMKEEYGYNLSDTIIALAIQLGIEQGRRIK